ncbi:hypothetical protein HN832_01325 [archaeon]|jgi:hypothetical protein|nr:hypothetical protein [archaeon]MBT4373913.1 hypothetical protein [archaeon]MBT4532190.1 hypothetical protein [archaeon]MBT7001143.1 hypothetical protein [archaeon]MBT7282032.1 hypothetical protein [archaeon]
MEELIQEKISADHLLYVSLKYTKTCDVIKNLLLRWTKMIETGIDSMLEHAKEKGKITLINTNPLGRIEATRKLFKKDKNMQKTLDEYMMFRKINDLKCDRIGEFRKNVNLRVYFRGKEVNVDLEKLKEYADMLEMFINTTKQFLLS